MPITWKNINSRSNETGAALLEGARESLGGANETFQKVFDRRRKTQKANRANTIDNNTSAFRDYVNQFDSPEALAQAEEEGLIEQKRNEFGAMLDREATRGLAGDQLSRLRQEETEQYNYEQNQLEQEEAPIRDDAIALARAGDTEGALDMAGGVENNADLVGTINEIGRSASDRKRRLADEAHLRERREITETRNDDEFERNKAERDRLRFADGVASNMAASREEQMARNAELGAQLVEEKGYPTNNGLLDVGSMNEEQLAEYGKLQEERGIDPALSVTASVARFKEELRNSDQNLRNSEIEAQTATYEEMLSSDSDLAQDDKLELQDRIGRLEQTYTRAQEQADAEHERLVAGNSYAAPQQSPDEITADVTGFMQEEGFNRFWRRDNTLRTRMTNTLTEVAESGIDIPLEAGAARRGRDGTKQGPGESGDTTGIADSEGVTVEDGRVRIPVTAAMIKTALNAVKDRGSNMDRKLREQLRTMVQQPGFKERYDEGVNANKRYQEESQTRRDAFNSGKIATESRFMKEQGIPAETTREQQARIEARLRNLRE